MATDTAALAHAWKACQTGNPAEGVRLTLRILQADPRNADAWCLLGIAQRAAGQPAQAETSCRAALRLRPDYFDAWNSLGNALLMQEKLDEAIAAFEQALRLRPDNPLAHNNLGAALRLQFRWAEAAEHYRQALRLQPNYPEAHNNLGEALQGLGRLEEAVASFQEALRLRPDYPEAHTNLGTALVGRKQPEEGMAHHREALRLRPGYAEAHYNLGLALAAQRQHAPAEASYREALRLKPACTEAHHHLGLVLETQRRFAEAEPCFREAIRLHPGYAEAHHHLGIVLAAQRRFAEVEACYAAAEECHRQNLRRRSGDPTLHNNFGAFLAERGRLDEAESCYREAVRLRPEFRDAWGNLASVLADRGKVAEAVAACDRLLEFEPDSPDAHVNRAFVLLNQGSWERAWEDYEWRWRCASTAPLPYQQPRWDGSPLAGRTILLHPEQGLGDTLLFVRYAPLVQQRGGTVLLGCPRPLHRLLTSVRGVDRVLQPGAPLPAFDCHAALMSLPGLFGTTPETVPADVPYLFADPALVEHWRRELPLTPHPSPPWGRGEKELLPSPLGGEGWGVRGRPFRVGIVWQGNPDFVADRQRSIPLKEFAPLAEVPGVQLISLQKGFGSEQLREVSFPVLDLAPRLDEEAGPFMDTAAVMKNLDLVITADTVSLHLAGALGVPVWAALSFAAYWCWLRDREDSPWYPTVRLFRQRTWGNWQEVFARLAAELKDLACRGR
jgi:tetratricopeptide (TPR) repeat protein